MFIQLDCSKIFGEKSIFVIILSSLSQPTLSLND